MIITLFKLVNMDHQINLLKMIGKLNGLSFLHTKHGDFFRKKVGASKTQIKTNPAFARTREINKEFGEISRAGKWIRTSLRHIIGCFTNDGVEIYRNKISKKWESSQQIDIYMFSPGIYYLQFQFVDHMEFHKFVKM